MSFSNCVNNVNNVLFNSFDHCHCKYCVWSNLLSHLIFIQSFVVIIGRQRHPKQSFLVTIGSFTYFHKQVDNFLHKYNNKTWDAKGLNGTFFNQSLLFSYDNANVLQS